MAKFYFTYGVGDPVDTHQAHRGGWTEVEAPDKGAAILAYKAYYCRNGEQFLPCCGVALTEEQMDMDYKDYPGQSMLKDGNGGRYCHDRIILTREVC